MKKIAKTKSNPHGLSSKQRLVVEDMVAKVAREEPISATDSTKKFYDTDNKDSIAVITSRNLSNADFREALLEGLQKKAILGKDSRVEAGLDAGLEAVDKDGNTDFLTRLKYIQEINKVAGVYAPEKHETKRMNLNLNMTKEELDSKIASLRKELEDI